MWRRNVVNDKFEQISEGATCFRVLCLYRNRSKQHDFQVVNLQFSHPASPTRGTKKVKT